MVSESKENSLAFPYERQAMNGEEMPAGMDYPDQVTYLCFRMLYAQLRMGIIDRDAAVREKRKIMREYEGYKSVDKMGQEWVQIIKETEIARADYRKHRCLENADKLIEAIEGVKYVKRVS